MIQSFRNCKAIVYIRKAADAKYGTNAEDLLLTAIKKHLAVNLITSWQV